MSAMKQQTDMELLGPKPKRPLSVFNLFFQSERQKMLESLPTRASGKPKRSHGKCNFGQMARLISKKWNEGDIDPAEKKAFEEIAKEEKKRYNVEMDDYKKRRQEFRDQGLLPNPQKKRKKKKASNAVASETAARPAVPDSKPAASAQNVNDATTNAMLGTMPSVQATASAATSASAAFGGLGAKPAAASSEDNAFDVLHAQLPTDSLAATETGSLGMPIAQQSSNPREALNFDLLASPTVKPPSNSMEDTDMIDMDIDSTSQFLFGEPSIGGISNFSLLSELTEDPAYIDLCSYISDIEESDLSIAPLINVNQPLAARMAPTPIEICVPQNDHSQAISQENRQVAYMRSSANVVSSSFDQSGPQSRVGITLTENLDSECANFLSNFFQNE